jgi:hypothetical protein
VVSRGILHDDRLFPDPFRFEPERFTDVDPRVPAAIDDFGRRVCPGRCMAQSFISIVVASVLSTFRIEKAVRDGRVVEPTGAYTPGILACVCCAPFFSEKCLTELPYRVLGVQKTSSAQSSRVRGSRRTRPRHRDHVSVGTRNGWGGAMPPFGTRREGASAVYAAFVQARHHAQ